MCMLVLHIRRISTKRPALQVQWIHREVHGREKAVTSAEALVPEQPGLVCKPSSDPVQAA